MAEVLREYLNQVNWARAGLGLPLVSLFTTNGENVHLIDVAVMFAQYFIG